MFISATKFLYNAFLHIKEQKLFVQFASKKHLFELFFIVQREIKFIVCLMYPVPEYCYKSKVFFL